MSTSRKCITIGVSVLAGMALMATGSIVLAGASGSSTTYYACLSKGALSKVGTVSPTCAPPSKVISWNSVGPQGPPGVAAPCSGFPHANANFIGCDLSGANLGDVDLTGTNLSGANLNHVYSGGTYGTPAALPTDWSLLGGFLIGPGANLSAASLTNLNLSTLNLQGALMKGTSLKGNDLGGTKFAGATLTNIAESPNTGTPASLPTGYIYLGGLFLGPGVNAYFNTIIDFSNQSLINLDLAGSSLYDFNFTNAQFTGANLSSVNFGYSNFTGASFVGANTSGITWYGDTCPDGTSSGFSGGSCVGHGGGL